MQPRHVPHISSDNDCALQRMAISDAHSGVTSAEQLRNRESARRRIRGLGFDANRRRLYNRLYMRRWRADALHLALERANRRRWHYERKLRQATNNEVDIRTGRQTPRVCAYCGKYAHGKDVVRLVTCESAPEGFAEVRVPYCGKC